MNMRHIFVTHKHVDHLMGIIWMVRMICQFMNHGEYKGEACHFSIEHKNIVLDRKHLVFCNYYRFLSGHK